MNGKSDVQSRKWLITTNNPQCATDCETDQDYKEALTEWVEERRNLFKSRSYVVA